MLRCSNMSIWGDQERCVFVSLPIRISLSSSEERLQWEPGACFSSGVCGHSAGRGKRNHSLLARLRRCLRISLFTQTKTLHYTHEWTEFEWFNHTNRITHQHLSFYFIFKMFWWMIVYQKAEEELYSSSSQLRKRQAELCSELFLYDTHSGLQRVAPTNQQNDLMKEFTLNENRLQEINEACRQKWVPISSLSSH